MIKKNILAALVVAIGLTMVAALGTIPASASSTGGEISNPTPAGLRPPGYAPNPEICPSESDSCVDRAVRSMQENYEALQCDHNAAFSSLYLDTTLYIKEAVRNDEFSDTPFWNKVTETFGAYYMRQYKNWSEGEPSRTSDAWRIAFESAENGDTSTVGDVFLGINAHVNRDLAFVYYQTGADNYDDHLHVNTVLNRARVTSWPNVANNLDGTVFAQLGNLPTGVDLDVFAWRDVAWENAQRLAAAPDAEARAVIAAEIEENARVHAREIREAFPATDAENASRDAYCATHR